MLTTNRKFASINSRLAASASKSAFVITARVRAGDLRLLGHQPEDDEAPVELWRGRGCETCRHTGYKGRLGIYEIMLLNAEVAELISRRAPVQDIKEAALANGMITLQMDGLRKVLDGLTTPEEIRRVVFTGGH